MRSATECAPCICAQRRKKGFLAAGVKTPALAFGVHHLEALLFDEGGVLLEFQPCLVPPDAERLGQPIAGIGPRPTRDFARRHKLVPTAPRIAAALLGLLIGVAQRRQTRVSHQFPRFEPEEASHNGGKLVTVPSLRSLTDQGQAKRCSLNEVLHKRCLTVPGTSLSPELRNSKRCLTVPGTRRNLGTWERTTHCG